MRDTDDEHMSDRAREVLSRVRRIPEGFVRAYGDLSPGAPRFTGAVLHAADDPELPWWRVVHADGSLAKGARQRARLEAEGVPFRGERVDMRVARIPMDVSDRRTFRSVERFMRADDGKARP